MTSKAGPGEAGAGEGQEAKRPKRLHEAPAAAPKDEQGRRKSAGKGRLERPAGRGKQRGRGGDHRKQDAHGLFP